MRFLAPEEAARYRSTHRNLVFLPYVVVIVGWMLMSLLNDEGPILLTLFILTLAGFGISAAAPILYRRWLIASIDPDPELRSKVLGIYFLSIPGSLLAVGELLDQAVVRGGGTPTWIAKRKKR